MRNIVKQYTFFQIAETHGSGFITLVFSESRRSFKKFSLWSDGVLRKVSKGGNVGWNAMPRYFKVDTIVKHALLRMDKQDLWRRFIGGTYETAETIGDYKVEYDKQDNGDIQFLIWNPSTPCVTVYIHGDEAILNSLEYSPKCTIDGHMKRGEGTRNMIQFAVDLAKHHGAKKMVLQDESTITCETGEKIKLGPFYFFKYGKTWYEKHFGFHPTTEWQGEYSHAKVLRKTLDVDNQPCNFFDRKMTNILLRKVELSFFQMVWEKTL